MLDAAASTAAARPDVSADGGNVRGLLTPTLDVLSAGGASLAALAVFALLPAATSTRLMAGGFIALSVLLNWPHFMASYHLLYSTPGAALKHPFAAKYVPAFLVVYVCAAAFVYGRAPLFAAVFHAAAAMFLAWHYTGQAWGTMASFARVERLRFSGGARALVRANLVALMAWHGLWAAHLVARAMGPALFNRAYEAASVVAALSALPGAAGLWLLRKETGRLPPRVVLPWLAIHGWYGLMFAFPGALGFMQLAQFSHAAQYLEFPARVRANRAGEEPGSRGGWVYLALLALAGWGAFGLLPKGAEALSPLLRLALPAGAAAALVTDALSIHHYFIDACIWKLGDPDVRRDLFAHLDARA